MAKVDYETSPEWADIVPIPQNEGGPNPLAVIHYPEEYSQAMSYLRAVMAANEHSQRVLNLTEHIIQMNPAHYTVWLYRAATLKALNVSPFDEIHWLNRISMRHLKNYQIWHHRQVVMSMHPALPIDEIRFLELMLSKDAKNYHVWSYRQWLVARFDLWPQLLAVPAVAPETTVTESEAMEHHHGDRGGSERGGSELDFTEHLLHHDVRNNSAWNHRFFVIFGRKEKGLEVSRQMCEHEVEFAKGKIELAPQNAAAWNYLKGVVAKMEGDVQGLEEFAGRFADVDKADEVRSSHALDFLAGFWAKSQAAKARKALDLLANRFDPIRKGYWEYRKESLPAEIEV